MAHVRPGKMVVHTGTAIAAGSLLKVSTTRSGAGGYKAKIKTLTASLDVSFDEGRTLFTQTVADGWQEYEGQFPSVFVADSGGTAVYTVIITTVA
jgi:hypothetical protein